MTLYNKIKWVLGILLVFVLILATNLIDRNNFLQVKKSVASLYEDRLLAHDHLFEMTRLNFEKEKAIITKNNAFFINEVKSNNAKFSAFVSKFEETKLTDKESIVFNSLKENLDVLLTSEQKYLKQSNSNFDSLLPLLATVNENIAELSKIQISEGSNEMLLTEDAVANVELFTHIEIYLLIFLAIVIQIIIMYNPKKE
mgnify:CR=1 FL=1